MTPSSPHDKPQATTLRLADQRRAQMWIVTDPRAAGERWALALLRGVR